MSKPTITQVIKSVLAAAIGVQSNDNRQKDFEQGSLQPILLREWFLLCFSFAVLSFLFLPF